MKQIIFILKVFYKFIYFFIAISLPVFLLYYWNFQYTDRILDFLKIILWPFIAIFFITTFQPEIKSFISDLEELDLFGNKAKRRQLPDQVIETPKETDLLSQFKGLNGAYQSQINALSSNIDILKNELTNRQIELDFERIYQLIFGSQIFLLKSIIHGNAILLSEVLKFYLEVQKANPVLQTWNVNQYLAFLIDRGLVQYDISGGYKITIKGSAFINYIENIMHYNLNKTL